MRQNWSPPVLLINIRNLYRDAWVSKTLEMGFLNDGMKEILIWWLQGIFALLFGT